MYIPRCVLTGCWSRQHAARIQAGTSQGKTENQLDARPADGSATPRRNTRWTQTGLRRWRTYLALRTRAKRFHLVSCRLRWGPLWCPSASLPIATIVITAVSDVTWSLVNSGLELYTLSKKIDNRLRLLRQILTVLKVLWEVLYGFSENLMTFAAVKESLKEAPLLRRAQRVRVLSWCTLWLINHFWMNEMNESAVI